MRDASSSTHEWLLPPGENEQYQAYDLAEDTTRSSHHYELDPEFFYTLTGGEWNVYSCSLWEPAFTMTQAQERKLDKFAELLQLQPGMRLLDVGCGWGGPLVYLCQRYGVIGHGITVTPDQIPEAEARAARYGVDARFELLHWQQLPETGSYDAIFTDEVLVHFNDLGGFFSKCHKVLRNGGVMAHKELHLTHSTYGVLGPIGKHINKVYGYTGNYITLQRELQLLDDNNFQLTNVYEIPIDQYRKTMDVWLSNMFDARERLVTLVGSEVYKGFRMYLKGYQYLFRTGHMRLDLVASKKMD